ncbi:unnamed protein product, partial [Prorocentrum cordatum]
GRATSSTSSPGESDDELYNRGLDTLLAEARRLMDAQRAIADALAAARSNAQDSWLAAGPGPAAACATRYGPGGPVHQKMCGGSSRPRSVARSRTQRTRRWRLSGRTWP